jgi:hypothetical protein
MQSGYSRLSRTSKRALTNVLIVVTLALTLISPAYASLEFHPATIVVSKSDQVKLSYIGESEVAILKEKKPPPGFSVFEENHTPLTGTVNISPENATEGTYQYTLAFYSSSNYTLILSVLKYNDTTPQITEYGIQEYKTGYHTTEVIHELECPANRTTQVNVSIRVIQPKLGATATAITLATLPTTPGWLVLVFAVALSVFLTTGILSILDLPKVRKGVWNLRQMAAALLIKHIFFGLALAFLAVAVTLLGTSLGALLTAGSTVEVGVIVWMLIISALPLLLFGVLYRIARAMGWYDLLEEGG